MGTSAVETGACATPVEGVREHGTAVSVGNRYVGTTHSGI